MAILLFRFLTRQSYRLQQDSILLFYVSYYKGNLLFFNHEYEEGKVVFNEALDYYPSADTLCPLRDLLKIATCYWFTKQYEKAVQYFQEIQRETDTDIDSTMTTRMIPHIGYSKGYFRPTSHGVFFESELASAPDRERLRLGVSYSMSQEMRQALAEAEIDVEIQKSVSGPQLFSVVSAQDAQNPAAAARGEGTPISAGQTCIIKGKNIKVGGEGAEIGVTIIRTDGSESTVHFFPIQKLYPNTTTQVGFVMPATAPDGSVWSVKLCTQLGSNGVSLLKEARTAMRADYFVVGVMSEAPVGDNQEGGQ